MPAVEPDEAGRGDDPHPLQAVLHLLIQDDIFPAPGADRLDQAPPVLSWAASGDGTLG